MIAAKVLKARLTLSEETDAGAVRRLRGLDKRGQRASLVERAVELGLQRYKVDLDTFCSPQELPSALVKPVEFYLWIYPKRNPRLANVWVGQGVGVKEIYIRTLFRIGFALLESGEESVVDLTKVVAQSHAQAAPPTNVSPAAPTGPIPQNSKLARLEAGWNT